MNIDMIVSVVLTFAIWLWTALYYIKQLNHEIEDQYVRKLYYRDKPVGGESNHPL